MGLLKSKLIIRRETKEALLRVLKTRNEKAIRAQRARILLLAAGGQSNAEIARTMGVSPHTVGKIRERFEATGIVALDDLPRSGRPVEITLKQRKLVAETVCKKPSPGLSKWSVRTLASRLDMAPATVGRILQELELRPHCLRTFTFSPDPRFEEKLLDVLGLYMNPPENGIVLCVDEKTGIQALDRTQPMLSLRSRRPRAWTNEYVRCGTRTMLACLDIKTGNVLAHVKPRRTSEDFLRFMDYVVKSNPNKRLFVVLDNLNTHTNQSAQEWLQRNPNVSFHFTPTHASWVNLIESFFSIMTRQGLQQSVYKSVRALENFLKSFIQEYNTQCGPFIWTKGEKKLRNIIQLTKEWQEQNATNL